MAAVAGKTAISQAAKLLKQANAADIVSGIAGIVRQIA